MDNILEVEHISKVFVSPLAFNKLLRLDFKMRKSTLALQDVSFSVRRNKILAVLGPNGAGKTTLLKIISTLILPDEGKVLVNGYRVGEDDEKIKSFLGFMSGDERSFYWRLTGIQNLEFFAALYGLSKRATKTRIDELISLFNVDYADKRFDSYSTGMKKHFALMRSLLHNPELLLLDEPYKSLDYSSSVNLKSLVKEGLVKTQGKTVIFTTHRMEEAIDFADLFMILHKGRLYAIGTQEELRKKINNATANLGQIFLQLTQEK